MKKLLFLLAGCLFIASIVLNFHLNRKVSVLSSKAGKNGSPSPSISPAVSVPPTEEKKKKKRVFHFDSARYSGWREAVIADFSNSAKVSAASLNKENAYKITPHVKLKSIQSNSGELLFSGDFVPGTTYLFRLADFLATADGRTLSHPAVFSVKIPDKDPTVKFLTEGPILPMKQEKLTLPYSVINVKEMVYEIRKFYKNTPENFVAGNRYYYSMDEDRSYCVYNKLVSFDLPGNKTKFRMLDLGPLLKKHGPGIYDISFIIKKATGNSSSYSSSRTTKKVVLTDLGITSALPGKLTTGEKGAVFVRTLSGNLPVADADVTLYSNKKQIFAKGRTDKDGKCVLTVRRTVDDKEDKAMLLVAKKGDDITYLDLGYKHNTTIFTDSGRVISNDMEAFLYTIRGICRPGEKINGGLFLRKTENGINKSVPSTTAAVTLTDPAGNALPVKNITLDENGFASFDFAIPADARTGSWNIAVRTPGADLKKDPLGKCSFLVGEYVPDRIKTQLKVKNDIAGITASDTITFLPAAAYYFGADLEEGTKGKLKVSSSRMQKNPAHWKGFAVGDPSAYKAGDIFTRDFFLQEKEILYPGFAAQDGKSFFPVILDAVFSVAEPGGRTVSTTLRIPCSVSPFYIGVSEEPRSSGKNLLVDWKLLSYRKDGKIAAAKRIYTINLVRKEWDHLLKEEGDSFSYEWVCKEVPVLEKDIVSDALSGVFDFGEQSSGEYVLKVSEGNNSLVTKTSFWHNAGDAGKRSANPSILSLKTDKQKYLPGETPEITFTSPGKGSLLIASGVKDNFAVQTFAVKEGKNTISVRIPENTASSLFPAGVTLLTGKNSKIIRSFALALLPVDLSASRKLDVALSLPEKARPNEKISLEVSLKTAGDLPAEGSVHIFGCDAGILSLTNWKTPDIYEFFSGKRLARYNYSDIYNKLFPSLSLLANGKFGGDGIALAKKSTASSMYLKQELKTQKPVLFSLGTVKTNKEGKGKAAITLPDFTGSMVITAVAADKTRTGAVSNDLLIRDRIGVTASLPRSAAPGDVLEGSFTLFNFDADNGDYSFTLTPPAGVKSTGKNSFTGKLAKGGQTTHRIKISSPEKTGTHTFAYSLVLKTKEGSFEKKGKVFLTVRHTTTVSRESNFTLLAAGKEMEVGTDNSKWYSAGLTRTVTVDSNPLSIVSDALDFLRNYPYGCLEQTAAAAFPLLSADLLVKCGMIGKDQAATSRHLAMRAAYRILSMMRFDGSFSMWPGGGPEYRTGTLFASHFLFEAGEKTAFELNPAVSNLITRHLYRIADNAALSRGERAYASYILALAKSGRFRTPAKNILAEEKKDIAALFAAMALIRGGYAAEGAYYMKELRDAEVWREQNMPYKYADDNVRMGMLLYILSSVQPEDPRCTALFARLQNSLRNDGSGWGTTQANAWAVMGLTSYAAAKDMVLSGKKDPCGYILAGNGKKITIFADKKLTIHVKEGEKIKIVNSSSAPLFIRSLASGILKKAHNVNKGMTISKEYFDEKGRKVSSVNHGDLVTVRITIHTTLPLSDAVICDLLPGGLEIEDGALATRAGKVKQAENAPFVKFRENRADRFLLFCNLDGTQSYSYKARAVIRGKYAMGTISAEGMYDPDTMARYTPEGVFEIK